MRLQTNLHLPTRQRLDGHHETHQETAQETCREIPQAFFHSTSLRRILKSTTIFAVPVAVILAARAASADPKPVGVPGWTTGSATYVRIRPGAQTPIVAKVSRRTQLMVWGTYAGWYRVETSDHKFGWIFHQYANVPKAQKLHELSHFKAKKASDQTGHQLLYGNPAQLKKYYAHYKAPGAKRGLAKQGVQLVSVSHASQKSVSKTPVKAVAKKATAKPVIAKAALRHAPSSPSVQTAPRVVTVPSAPDKSTPIAPIVASAPRPVVVTATAKKVVTKTTRKTVTRKSQSSHPVMASVDSMPSGQLPRITAEDIMRARREHLQHMPSFRHKVRPEYEPRSTPKPQSSAKTPPSNSSKSQKATVKPMSMPLNRGGSPRDMARWAQANNKFGDGLAKQALSYRGTPYISGASNPNRGFDCSGLIYYLLRTRGYHPPRTAADLTSVGKSVPKSQLKPGDIVFFANTYKHGVSHVGVYIGNGQFVHAPHSGSSVKTDSLNSSYYSKKYWGARRIK